MVSWSIQQPMSTPPNREVALFSAALELPTNERAAYLDEACANDPGLRQRLAALLRVHEEAIPFLETPAAAPHEIRAGAAGPGGTMRLNSSPAEEAGDRIGRYKLLQQIGEGGCGVVYMAEQEEPVRRRVALKVIKLGMDTKQVIARFEAERQALALMDHPNIAKVFDAGATDTGRLFFVMELVRGIKITDYCDQNQVSTKDRLKLFIQVCQAIQHAHQKGIIHRDIKPSNILVADHDGVPVPKIIDFGIAKATTDQRLTDKTLFTAFEQFMGTPAYMSPEQARMSGLDIDTRTDIYSLGVLLYELLTSKTPFDARDLLAAGLEEMRRTISEREPARPSTRLSTMLETEQTTIAKYRHTDGPKLVHLLRGDLDWIVMKALEKDRARRYETANGLGGDIQRHLNCEPVVARPPSRLYEFQKTVRRHKFGFAAATALILVLATGALVSTLEAIRARTEAAKATAVSDLLQEVLSSANPEALKGSDYTVRQMLDDYASRLGGQLRNQPEVEAEIRWTLGRAYWRLGQVDKAQPQLERALTLRRRSGPPEKIAATLVDCAWNSFEQDQLTKGQLKAKEALDIYRRRGTAVQIISALRALQVGMIAAGRVAEVEAITDEAVTIAGKTPGFECPDLANIIHGLGEIRIGQSRYAEGEALEQKAIAMHKRLRPEGDLETAWALHNLGDAQMRQHKLAEAEAALREALGTFRRSYSEGHKSVDQTLSMLRDVLQAKGDSAGLEALERERWAEANQRVIRNEAVAQAWMQLCLIDADRKEWQAATQHFAMAIALCSGQSAAARNLVGEACLQLADRAQHGRPEFAERACWQAAALFRQLAQEDPRSTTLRQRLANSLHQLADILLGEGKGAAAEEACREGIPLMEDLLQTNIDIHYAAVFTERLATDSLRLVGPLRGRGKPGEADTIAREAIQKCRTAMAQRGKVASETAPEKWCWGFAVAQETLAELFRGLGQPQEAERAYRDAEALWRKLLANFSTEEDYRFHLAVNRDALAGFLREAGRKAESLQAYQEAQAVWLKLVVEFNQEDRRVHLGWTDENIGQLLRETGKFEEAAGAYRQALTIWKQLVADFKKADYRDHLTRTQLDLAAVLKSQNQPEEAASRLREAGEVVLSLPDREFAALPGQTVAQLIHAGPQPQARDLGDKIMRRTLTNAAWLNDVAWTLVIAETPTSWDSALAVELARQAVAATRRKDAMILDTLAAAYAEVGQFTNAVSVQQEAIGLLQNEDQKLDYGSRLKLYQSNHPYRDHGLLAERAATLLQGGKFAEAERPARECLALREAEIPDNWRTFNARSLLGGSLLGQKKYAAAEPLLLSGYEGLRQRERQIPPEGKPRLREALQRLVQLYEVTDQPDQAAQWKYKLAESDTTQK